MRYLKIAAIGLAAMLFQPVHAQKTPSKKSDGRQVTYQRDLEFEGLYTDLKRFEDQNRGKEYENYMDRTDSIAGKKFRGELNKLPGRHGFYLDGTVNVFTCGNYIGSRFEDPSRTLELREEFMFGEFFAVERNFRGTSKKIYVIQDKDGFSIRNSIDVPQEYNMQPVSETDFSSLREAIQLYNSQLQYMDPIYLSSEGERYGCIYDQLLDISLELAKLSGIEACDACVSQTRAPKGTLNIVMSGIGQYHEKTGLFTLSVSPDGKTDLWFKDKDGNEIREETEIKFAKPEK